MASPSYTYTLTNDTTADATQVMQNFNDILNGVTDGTKDLAINALTVAGTATLNGAINLGNSSADDITITGSLASTVPIKTTNSYNIGSSTLGLAGIYFGSSDSDTIRVVGVSSLAASRTYTIPDVGGNSSFFMHKGTTAAGDATAGDVGEVLMSEVTNGPELPGGANEYQSLTSLSLTAGDWDVRAHISLSATSVYTSGFFGALTIHDGNDGTNINFASGILYYEFPVNVRPTTDNSTSFFVGPARVNISSTTTYYLKFRSVYSLPKPTYNCRLVARRVR